MDGSVSQTFCNGSMWWKGAEMKRKKLTYYGKKCLIFLISVFILSVAVFYVARLAPGDPLISYYGDRTE